MKSREELKKYFKELDNKVRISFVIILIIIMLMLIDMVVYCVGGNSLILGRIFFSSKGTVQSVEIIKDNPILNNSTPVDASTEKNYFSVEVNSTSSYDNGTILTHVANPGTNYYSCYIEFKLADGTVLYTSKKLKPNQYMDTIPINLSLEKGSHEFDIVYNIFDDNADIIGVQIVATKLNVRG